LMVLKRTPLAFPLRRIERLASVIPTRAQSSLEVMPRCFRISSRWTVIAKMHLLYEEIVVFFKLSGFPDEPGKQQGSKAEEHQIQGDHQIQVDLKKDLGEQQLDEIETQ